MKSIILSAILLIASLVSAKAGPYDDALIIQFQVNGNTSDVYNYVTTVPATGYSLLFHDPALSNTGNTQGTLLMPSLTSRFAFDTMTETLDIDVSDKADASALTSGLAGKANSSHTHVATDISDSTSVGRSVLTAANAAAARTAIGAGTSTFSGAYTDLTGKPTLFSGAYSDLTGVPSTFTPSSHTHTASQISDSTTVGRAVMTATDAAAARSAIGAGTGNGSGTVTSVIAGTGLSGGTITSTGTISMPNTGTAGTYGQVTTDAQGRVTAGKRTETYSGTTSGSGTYTVTFATAYSVAPNIQQNPTNLSSDNIFTRVTAISTTGFTILARTRTDVAGLLPTFAVTNGINIDVLITEK